MEDLFRFVMFRPAQKADQEKVVSVEANTDLQNDLKAARAGSNAREAMKNRALEYAASEDFIRDPTTLKYYEQLLRLEMQINVQDKLNLKKLRDLIREIFGVGAATLLTEDLDFARDMQRIADTIITIKMTPTEQPGVILVLTRLMRLVTIIKEAANNNPILDEADAAQLYLRQTITLPDKIFPLPDDDNSIPAELAVQSAAQGAIQLSQDLDDRYQTLRSAMRELLIMNPQDFKKPEDAVKQEATKDVTSKTSDSGQPAAMTTTAEPLRLTVEAIDKLSTRTKDLLGELKLDPNQLSVPLMVGRIESEIAELAIEKAETYVAEPQQRIAKFGSSLVQFGRQRTLGLSTGAIAADSIPTSHGTLRPVGVGDLLVVRQHLKRYEGGEVAHIENILKGESKEREHRRSRLVEETFTLETETITEEERDLQTTERAELQSETSKTIKEDSSLKLGASITAKYGPWVEFKASTEYATNQSKEESTKQAAKYAKDVTDRSASKVTQRIKETVTRRVVEETEEKNRHGVDNTGGQEHVVGVYQWVNKVYEAQAFNYGRRRLFDIMVPEPAAFLLYAFQEKLPEAGELIKPDPFTISAAEITEMNYLTLAKQYRATDINPPPRNFISVSATYGEKAEDESFGVLTKTEKITIPEGYMATSGFVGIQDSAVNRIPKDAAVVVRIDLYIGRKWIIGDINAPVEVKTFDLNHEVNDVPVALLTHGKGSYVCTIELICQRTDELLVKWKIKTHAAIMQGYLKQLGDYEEKLAALEVQQGIEFEGRNPDLNRVLEKNELKKACISILTNQHFDLFGAINSGPYRYPHIDIGEANAEGRYIRFFEQAFEWEQITYVFYPYYWGRKANWVERLLIEDPDPIHAEFLKAGAARVVVPIREGFEPAINHFLDTGDIWNGGDLPDTTSPLYLSVVEEIKEQQDAPGDELPYGAPWEVRLPTTLVALRRDSALPEWEKDENGNWVPVEG